MRIHRLIKDFVDKGSHKVIVATANKGTKGDKGDRRQYQAICKTAGCGWTGSKTTGALADDELEKHRDETVAAALAQATSEHASDEKDATPAESVQEPEKEPEKEGEAESEEEEARAEGIEA